MHAFSGVRAGDLRNRRDWILTTLWVVCMDVLSLGLVVLVGSGVYLWVGLRQKRRPGALALAGGCVLCGWFVWGLRWLY